MKKQILMSKSVILMVGILLFSGGLTKATLTNWNIYSSTTIGSGTYGTVNVYDSQTIPPIQTTINMTGGDIAECHVYDTAIFNYRDGGIVYFVTHENSMVEVHSNYDYGFAMEDNSKISLYNGDSGLQVLIVSPDSQLHIYGYSLTLTPSISAGIIEGNWADSNQRFSLTVRLAGEINPQDVIFLHIIPEPTTLLLFTFGGFFLRKHHKRFSPQN